MTRLLFALLVLLLPAMAAPQIAMAQDGLRTERVRFPTGASNATLRGRIVGRETVNYLVDARAGQRMTVSLNSPSTSIYFNVYEPGTGPGDQALAAGDLTGPMMPELNRFDGRLAKSGVYTISVYLFRNAARRGDRADFAIDIGVSGGAPRPPATNPPDGTVGGPGFWRVTGVASGDLLNIRSAPTTLSEVVRRVPDGSILRNLGCRVIAQQQWCNVETTANPKIAGWASARYLREASAPSQPSQPRPPVGNRPPDVAEGPGRLPCARGRGQLTTSCRITVDRTGRRQGAVIFLWPDGGNRIIYFEGGEPTDFEQVRSDSNPRMRVQEEAGLYFVRVGDERFELPASLLGGR